MDVGISSGNEDTRHGSVKVRPEVLQSGRKEALDTCLWCHDGAKTRARQKASGVEPLHGSATGRDDALT